MRGPANSRVLHTSTLLLPHGVWGEGQVRESRQLKSPQVQCQKDLRQSYWDVRSSKGPGFLP